MCYRRLISIWKYSMELSILRDFESFTFHELSNHQMVLFIRFHHLECLWQIQIWIICCKIQTCGLSFFICICVILPSSLKASLISLTLSLSLALFAIRRCLSRSSRSWGVKWLKSSSFSFFAKPEGSFSAAEI